jgi:hypothetical protein
MQNLILKRNLVMMFTAGDGSIHKFENLYSRVLKISYGISHSLKEGEWLDPIPKDRKYVMCHIKLQTTGQYEQVMMMLDEHYVILLRPD